MIVSMYLIKCKQHSTVSISPLDLIQLRGNVREIWAIPLVQTWHESRLQGPSLPKWLLKTQERGKWGASLKFEPTSNFTVINYRQGDHITGSQIKAVSSCPKPFTSIYWGTIPKSCQLLQTEVSVCFEVQNKLPINLDIYFAPVLSIGEAAPQNLCSV